MTGTNLSSPRQFSYNPFDQEIRNNPYPLYHYLHQHDPLQFNPYANIWFLTRYQDCEQVLHDVRFSAELGQNMRRRDDPLPRSMLNTDLPDHNRLRIPASRALSANLLEQLHSHIQAISEEILCKLSDESEVDIMTRYAEPLTLRVLAEALRVPDHDLGRFSNWVSRASGNLDPLAPPRLQHEAKTAAMTLDEYFATLISERRQSAGDDLLSALLREADQNQNIALHEVVTMCQLFVVGGYEPTACLIGNGLLALLRHQDQLRRLREDDTLAKSAVEELLRFDSPIPFTARVAREDVEINNQLIRSGQAVVTLFGAANYDPSVFSEPDRLDLGRSPNPHMAFGHGIHFCLGAPFARLIGQVALTDLVRRFPRLRLSTHSHVWRESVVPHGLETLYVALV